ncbi:unnamed protein product [Adineta steineri]|uniref:Uncharacterized protein n=1 Tax=Adineta steineri TaxID=433720 RepID=A0A819C9N6_9BILA|nr:unnamed protein product [Adineta steineri]
MIVEFFLINLFLFFSLTNASHFLGGSFTYRHISQPIDYNRYKPILVELRFHISNHYFICTPEQVNDHMIVYLIGESVPYDSINNTYLWYETEAIRRNINFYNIEFTCKSNNYACKNFQEKTWGYCESVNQNSGYSILRRQFLLIMEKYEQIQLYYSSCCWASSKDKHFYFNLTIGAQSSRINSSPYPYIPASYYVDINQPREIQIFAYDSDNDEILCEQFEDDLGKFLTVHVNHECKLSYQTNQLGKQFGQFWLIDRDNNQILSRSLISIQVHVLEDIICNTQPELIIKNNEDHSNMTITKIKHTVYISVSVNPNCLLIEPQDQTITELTTLCTNNQPIILANGGIEVIFECTPNLCEKYQICFVGEFALKLPSTDVRCFSIEVIGTNECTLAMNNYNFLKPPNRHFVISEPIIQKQTTITSLSTTILMNTTVLTNTTMLLPLASPTRKWSWIIIIILFLLLISFIGYFGIKKILLIFYQHTIENNQFRSSNRSSSFISTASDRTPTPPNIKQAYTAITTHDEDNNLLDSPMKVKSRTQYIRQGFYDRNDL